MTNDLNKVTEEMGLLGAVADAARRLLAALRAAEPHLHRVWCANGRARQVPEALRALHVRPGPWGRTPAEAVERARAAGWVVRHEPEPSDRNHASAWTIRCPGCAAGLAEDVARAASARASA